MPKTENGTAAGRNIPKELLNEPHYGLQANKIRAILSDEEELVVALGMMSQLHDEMSKLTGAIFSLYREIDEFHDRKLGQISDARELIKAKVHQMSQVEAKIREQIG